MTQQGDLVSARSRENVWSRLLSLHMTGLANCSVPCESSLSRRTDLSKLLLLTMDRLNRLSLWCGASGPMRKLFAITEALAPTDHVPRPWLKRQATLS